MKVADVDPTSLRTWAEISPAALQANARAVRKRCPDAGLVAVLKADAYGHDASIAARALGELADFYAVANLGEARALRAEAPPKPILILSPALPEERAPLAAEDFIPTVSNSEEMAAFAILGRTKPVPVNFKIDTGMGRLGASLADAAELLAVARRLAGLQIRQISSHLPSADTDATFTERQLRQFDEFARDQRPHFPQAAFHVLNSAGILRFGNLAQDLVRPGLILYGVSPLPEFQAEFQPASTWKTRISLLRDLPAGQGVSYGGTYRAPKPIRVALLAVGYADGYPRTLSNRGAEVLIRGRRCPVRGIVTMDLVIADVTEMPEAAVGDEVVLLGAQGSDRITAQELAEKAGTIPWEILTGIQSRVRRVSG